MSHQAQIELRVITYPEEGVWLAHCLELDLVAEGKSPKNALADLIDLCLLQIKTASEENDLVSIIRPAPPEYWKMFFSARKKKRIKPGAGGILTQIEEREFELV